MKRRRPIAAAAGVFMALAALATPAATAVPAQSTPDRIPRLTVEHQSLEVAPAGDWVALLTLHDAPPGGHLAVDLYDRIDDDESFGLAMLGEPQDKLATFPVIDLRTEPTRSQPSGITIQLREPGSVRPVEPGRSWVLDEPGVYPVGIRLRDSDGAEISSTITYLVRLPAEDEQLPRLHVALLASVTAPDRVDEPLDPELASALGELVYTAEANPDVPMSFDIPSSRLRQLIDAGTDAEEVLAILRDALAGDRRELLSSTRFPIDATTLVANGLGGDVGAQISLGSSDLADGLGIEPAPILSMDDSIDSATATVIADAGVTALAAAPGAIGSGPPGPPASLAGAEGLAVVSEGLIELGNADTDDDPILTANRLIAHGLARAHISSVDPSGGAADGGERPPAAPDVATVISIDPATTDLEVLDSLLGLLSQPAGTWTTGTIGDLLDIPSRAGPYDLPAIETEDLSSYVAARTDVTGLAASRRTMLEDPAAHDDAIRDLLATSVDARLDAAGRNDVLAGISADIHEMFGSISTAPTERVTLGARDAEIPLRVLSTADAPLRVRVEMRSSERLQFPREEMIVTLQPDGPTVVRVPVHTRTSGDTPMTITLTSPDGAVRLAQTRYTVRSTAVSGVGVVLTIGAAGFLVLWWGRHILRARREDARAKL